MNPAEPPTYPNGACIACLASLPACTYHRAEQSRQEKARRENFRLTIEGARRNDLARLCMKHELESDEGGTRMEKAAILLSRHGRFA